MGWMFYAFISGLINLLIGRKSLNISVNQYMSVADSDSLSFVSGEMSITCWIYMEDATNFIIASKQGEYLFQTNASDKLQVTLYDDSASSFITRIYDTALTSQEKKWLFVEFNYNGNGSFTGIDLKINSQTVDDAGTGSGVFTAMENLGNEFRTGFDGTNYANGKIDQLTVWDKALTIKESREISTFRDYRKTSINSSAILSFKFEDSYISGSTVSPLIGLLNGTLVNSPSNVHSIPLPYRQSLMDNFVSPSETYNNAVPWQEQGFAFDFNGSNKYINVGNVADLQITNNLSVFAWVKTSQSATARGIISRFITTGNQRSYALVSSHIDGSKFQAIVSSNGSFSGTVAKRYSSSISYTNNAWHLIGFTFASGTLKLYIDGIEDPSPTIHEDGAITTIHAGTAPFEIARYAAANLWQGRISSCYVFDTTVLSLSEIQELYNKGREYHVNQSSIANNLAFYTNGYSSLSGAGGVLDLSSNGNNGTMVNMTNADILNSSQDTTVSRLEDHSGSYSFNGVNQYANLGNILSIEHDQAASVSIWFRSTSAGAIALMAKQSGSGDFTGWNILLNAGALVVSLINDVSPSRFLQLTTSSTFNDGFWHNIIWTKGATGALSDSDIVVDGSIISLASSSDTLGTFSSVSADNLNIAARNNGDLDFIGNINHVSFWNKKLTLDECQELYNNGFPTDLMQHNASADLVSWWKMDASDTTSTLNDSAGVNDGAYINSPTLDLYNYPAG